MADLERTYNIPLRREFLKVPRYRRTNKAVIALKDFVMKHMKTQDVRIGPYLNQELWKDGIKNPPHHVKVTVVKKADKVYVELTGKPMQADKKEEKKTLAEKVLGKKKDTTKESKENKEKSKAVDAEVISESLHSEQRKEFKHRSANKEKDNAQKATSRASEQLKTK